MPMWGLRVVGTRLLSEDAHAAACQGGRDSGRGGETGASSASIWAGPTQVMTNEFAKRSLKRPQQTRPDERQPTRIMGHASNCRIARLRQRTFDDAVAYNLKLPKLLIEAISNRWSRSAGAVWRCGIEERDV